ncbi:MAG TPA: dienelactone hydrolase family protein [Puia sp.]|nr:dienelactone hydrolase family protein [Puia sp.]
MHEELIIYAGNKINAKKALIMLHGRGADAEDILALAENLNVTDYLLAAPQASGNSWYPNSFLANPKNNEPWLSSALDLVHIVVAGFIKQGIKKDKIYFLGFSQGACLTLEYTARNADQYGGIVAFTGGLIGDKIYTENYKGTFKNTPIFIGTSNPDFHVPVERVKATTVILKELGADITEKIYPDMGHTINQDEINHANNLIFKP